MVTAANGAEKFYDNATNEARYESVEEAVEKDDRIQQAYQGHSHLFIIDNSTDFNSKVKRAQEQVHYVLGHKRGV
jgi:hypothetical protein